MGRGIGLQLSLADVDRERIELLLSGGKQEVRTVVRAEFLLDIATAYSAAETIHLVLDSLSTPTRKAATDWFGEQEGGWLWSGFTMHPTPIHGSWLKQAEIEIGLFSRQCLGKRRIASIEELTQYADAWNQRTNQDKTIIDWKFTRKKARLKLKYKLIRS